MGLIYDSGDSGSVKGALAGNLAAARLVLDASERATGRLVAALGAGELSGRGYSAVDALFAQIIAPCVVAAKGELDAIQTELDRYTVADAKVSPFGVLKEDELKVQLTASRTQRDATERQIQANEAVAVSLPGVGEPFRAVNAELELVLTQLENDIRELEAKLQALRDFAATTAGLFLGRVENLAAVTGDTVALLKQLSEPAVGPGMRLNVVAATGLGLGAFATRKSILDNLAGNKLTVDAKGRVNAGGRYFYRTETENLYKRGKAFNGATGTRIDHYKQPVKAGSSAALASPVDDFKGWKDASKLAKAGKGLGIAGSALTVAGNADKYFGDGVQGTDVQDFAVDTGVDLASAAAAAGIGAVVGSAFLPPLGTIIGAGFGLAVSVALDNDLLGIGTSATDAAKDAIKKTYR